LVAPEYPAIDAVGDRLALSCRQQRIDDGNRRIRAAGVECGMTTPSGRAHIRQLGIAVTEIRTGNRWSQRELSRRSGISQSTISRLECARLPDPSLPMVASLIEAMGGRLRIEVDSPFLGDRRQQVDPAHARMSGYIGRRLRGQGWSVETEVEVGEGRSLGWIDLFAFNPLSRRLLVIEIKTEIHDLGRIDRTLGRYERESWTGARRLGWRPSAVTGCLVLLMTQANDSAVRFNREKPRRSVSGSRARADEAR
jgi:transcriptional regulator with XRE-family HTH domain